jgi:hypothetical protein
MWCLPAFYLYTGFRLLSKRSLPGVQGCHLQLQDSLCLLPPPVDEPCGPRAGHTGHTELSFTNPRTESSCRESWLARPSTCIVRLCVRGLPASNRGGDGASSGVRNWWPPCSSFKGRRLESVVSVVRLGMEEGGVGWPSVRLVHGVPRPGFPGRCSSSLVRLGSLCSRGVAAACKTNLVLWMHWSWSHWRAAGASKEKTGGGGKGGAGGGKV